MLLGALFGTAHDFLVPRLEFLSTFGTDLHKQRISVVLSAFLGAVYLSGGRRSEFPTAKHTFPGSNVLYRILQFFKADPIHLTFYGVILLHIHLVVAEFPATHRRTTFRVGMMFRRSEFLPTPTTHPAFDYNTTSLQDTGIMIYVPTFF